METLILMPFGYCIGKLYSQKISRNWYLKNQELIDTSKASNKTLIRTILSSDRFIKTFNIREKKNNEIKKLENQFITEYPHLSLNERIKLANNVVEIKYFDEIETIKKDYIDKIEIVNYKIDEFYETELRMVKEDFFYYDMLKIHNTRQNFIEKLKSILLTDNIDDLINFKYNEEL
jgi:hypothetical protein